MSNVSLRPTPKSPVLSSPLPQPITALPPLYNPPAIITDNLLIPGSPIKTSTSASRLRTKPLTKETMLEQYESELHFAPINTTGYLSYYAIPITAQEVIFKLMGYPNSSPNIGDIAPTSGNQRPSIQVFRPNTNINRRVPEAKSRFSRSNISRATPATEFAENDYCLGCRK